MAVVVTPGVAAIDRSENSDKDLVRKVENVEGSHGRSGELIDGFPGLLDLDVCDAFRSIRGQELSFG